MYDAIKIVDNVALNTKFLICHIVNLPKCGPNQLWRINTNIHCTYVCTHVHMYIRTWHSVSTYSGGFDVYSIQIAVHFFMYSACTCGILYAC